MIQPIKENAQARIAAVGLVLMAFVAVPVAAQTGKLRLVVDPGGSYAFIVDHQQRMQQREVELSAGSHHLTFWAPERRIVDTTVTVETDRTHDLVIRLPYSAEFLAYQRDLKRYRSRMKTSRMYPTILTAGSAVWTVLNFVKYKDAQNVLQDNLDLYNVSVTPGTINVLKDTTIPANRETFDQAERRFRTAAGVTLLAAGVTTFLYMKSARHPVPVFQDAEKVRFDGLVWLPGEDGGQWMAGLTIKLN